ncbi:hypothetical protein B5S33_g5753 [[Candida] boidinii]|nr:hypothetical protein B5S33_g5753 [[Candida] boidinii]
MNGSPSDDGNQRQRNEDVTTPPAQSQSDVGKALPTNKGSNNNETRGHRSIQEGDSKNNDTPSESDGKDQIANNETSATNREVPPPPAQSQSDVGKALPTNKGSNNNETRGHRSIQEGDSKNNDTPSESDGKDQIANNETSATNREVPPPSAQPQLNSDENVDGELPPPDNRNIFIRAREAEETENRELPPPDNRNIFIRAREAEQNYHLAFFSINSFLTAYHTGVGTASAAYPFKEWDKTSDRDRVLGTMSFIGVVLLTILPYIWYCTFFWKEKIAKKRENREREPDA